MDAIRTYLNETWSLIAEMGPYLLLGFLVAGLLHKWILQSWIESHLGRPGLRSIMLASLFGVPMPLCSCGVIPVTASLREKGASKGAAASFLTSTPQTGVDSILATYGMLGPVFALYRVIVAFVSGIGVGLTVERFGRKTDTSSRRILPACDEDRPTWGESVRYGLVTLPGDIAASLFIGFLLAGVISSMAPDNLLAQLPGGVYTSILLTTLIAVPFYICSTGSIPLALALIESGLPVSAALVLLIAGPATNVATITTMRKTLGGRETTIYVSMIIAISWIAALVFHVFLDTSEFNFGHVHLEDLPAWAHASGVALLAMLAFGYWRNAGTRSAGAAFVESAWDDPQVATFTIGGMTCSQCRKSALQGLSRLPGTKRVSVDLKSGRALVRGTEVSPEAVSHALEPLGYTVSDFSLQDRSSST